MIIVMGGDEVVADRLHLVNACLSLPALFVISLLPLLLSLSG